MQRTHKGSNPYCRYYFLRIWINKKNNIIFQEAWHCYMCLLSNGRMNFMKSNFNEFKSYQLTRPKQNNLMIIHYLIIFLMFSQKKLVFVFGKNVRRWSQIIFFCVGQHLVFCNKMKNVSVQQKKNWFNLNFYLIVS